MQTFQIRGIPKPQARARFFVTNGKMGRYSPNKADEYNIRAQLVAQGAQYIAEGPVLVHLRCYFPRPKCHFGAKGLRKAAPEHHTQKPDIDNCVKGFLDAARGVLWRDDVQIVAVSGMKYWTDGEPRTEVEVRRDAV